MNSSDFKVGQNVYFGRANGEKTLAKISKLNPVKAVVRTLEVRGRGRGSEIGSEWTVPYNMLTPADNNTVGQSTPKKIPLKYSPFSYVENLILEGIMCVYNNLSPENLSCDGEIGITQIRHRQSILNRQLKGLEHAYGQRVDEEDIYQWWKSKDEWEKTNGKKKVAMLTPLVELPPITNSTQIFPPK